MTDVPAPPARRIPRPVPGRLDPDGIRETLAYRMMYSVAKDGYTATDFDLYQGMAYAVRDRLMERWFLTQDAYHRTDAKRVYYLSLEFLMGRALRNNILSLGSGSLGAHGKVLAELGLELEEMEAQEVDAGLGNGGLGRLAACYLDSAATLALPFHGYGIRYEFGMFRQRIRDGYQVEAADNWLRYGNPWEIPRPDALFPVQFYGTARTYRDDAGHERADWVDTETVYAMAYDTPIAGFRNDTVNSLRLWAAKSSREFDLGRFHSGDYVRAVEAKSQSENISKVLYPPDESVVGKELRLKQQYFFVSATLQDILRRFQKRPGRRIEELPVRVALQLNDTHPSVAIPELMRILVDGEARLGWDQAWAITTQVFGYTNHTVLPEALETWSAELFGRLLPRHLQIIEEIDRRFGLVVSEKFPGDADRVRRTSIVTEGEPRMLRMAHLGFVGSRAVNGVSEIHTGILRKTLFRDFDEIFPGRLLNVTNGVTPRRWLLQCNPRLSALITEAIGEGWTTELAQLRGLAGFASDASFRERWQAIKRANKVSLSHWALDMHGLRLDPEALCDTQVKRIHEYKRQLLNVLHVLALYLRVKDGAEIQPRTVLFAGKAAPSYAMAKRIIKLIHAVADLVNGDPTTAGRLRVVFIPNYGVSAAEMIFPACELSQQISTAGTEASGTGVMKAALNGALTIGTLDGATIEMRDEVGSENVFQFGNTAEEIVALARSGTPPSVFVERDDELRRVLEFLAKGPLEEVFPGLFSPIVQVLVGWDRFHHAADFATYRDAQRRAEAAYRDGDWTGMSIRTVAEMGRFSSDRAVQKYATDIWGAAAVPVKLGV
ncbi:MAG: glycogen/starch/alpha-glucan phosphorylase [Thermoanaerobaculia bacterium]